MGLEIELGVLGRGRTRKEAMEDAEKNSMELLKKRQLDYNLILYGRENIFFGSEPYIEVMREVKFVKVNRRA
ncbi:MAG: hypothetical protein U1B79_01425 [Candidatus Pacearchaeota archaeon]|nr:hypothetical protein [Nanoarchaeota archaeon]MDZ4226752.1 hypothetical protein [Candidatus Pacearchaeota archaeon]